MRNATIAAVDGLDPRLIVGVGALIIAVLAFEGWMVVLRKPFAEYQQVVEARSKLHSVLSQEPDPSSEVEHLAAEYQRLAASLSEKLQLPTSDDKIAASLMEALDRSARQHGVKLSAVKPRDRRLVSAFEEVSFEVGAEGNYLPLCEWILDFENALGSNVNIAGLDMKAVEEGRKVQLTLDLAVYRPQTSVEGTK
jgi:Tfp pilus assembly protein PilO